MNNLISFGFIMQLKKSYYIATNDSGRKSATNFVDLPDCLRKCIQSPIVITRQNSKLHILNIL